MKNSIISILRMSLGLILLLLGIIGLFIPFLQGFLLIAIAIPLISPEHGRKVSAKMKSWLKKKTYSSTSPTLPTGQEDSE